jgi:hypothetical protein
VSLSLARTQAHQSLRNAERGGRSSFSLHNLCLLSGNVSRFNTRDSHLTTKPKHKNQKEKEEKEKESRYRVPTYLPTYRPLLFSLFIYLFIFG